MAKKNMSSRTDPVVKDVEAPNAQLRAHFAKLHQDRFQLIPMLRRKDSTTIAQIAEAAGWQSHTERGAFAGALKKRLGLDRCSEKVAHRGRVYRIQR